MCIGVGQGIATLWEACLTKRDETGYVSLSTR